MAAGQGSRSPTTPSLPFMLGSAPSFAAGLNLSTGPKRAAGLRLCGLGPYLLSLTSADSYVLTFAAQDLPLSTLLLPGDGAAGMLKHADGMGREAAMSPWGWWQRWDHQSHVVGEDNWKVPGCV